MPTPYQPRDLCSWKEQSAAEVFLVQIPTPSNFSLWAAAAWKGLFAGTNELGRHISLTNLLLDRVQASTDSNDCLEGIASAKEAKIVGRIFDFGNSRWAEEPSEQDRRHHRTRSLAEDDCWTGTYAFLFRGALFLDEIEHNAGMGLTPGLSALAKHQHWHDAESLFLCLWALLMSKLSANKRVQYKLKVWLESTEAAGKRSDFPEVTSFRDTLEMCFPQTKPQAQEHASETMLVALTQLSRGLIQAPSTAAKHAQFRQRATNVHPRAYSL